MTTYTVEAVAQSRLCNSGYPELQFIACRFDRDVLVLHGRVSSFYLKQLAQTLVRELDDVDKIDNRLEVYLPPDPP